jgi:hypothetical protein
VGEPSEDRSSDLHVVSPVGPLYRIARLPDPWAWPDWANVGGDGTFGNRWDDPQGLYRVVYASSSLLGALVEVLARFRPDPHILAALKQIDEKEEDRFQPPGELDVAWLENRCIGVARVEGAFADVGHSNSLARLREALAPRIAHHGLDDLDAASVRLTVPRRFTQEISRYVYDCSTPEGQRRFAGVAYRSRLGDDFRNWAIFESSGSATPWLRGAETRALAENDPDLGRALELLDVRLIAS